MASPGWQAAAVRLFPLLIHRGEVEVSIVPLDNFRVDFHLAFARACDPATAQFRNHVAAVQHRARFRNVFEQMGGRIFHAARRHAKPDMPARIAAGRSPYRGSASKRWNGNHLEIGSVERIGGRAIEHTTGRIRAWVQRLFRRPDFRARPEADSAQRCHARAQTTKQRAPRKLGKFTH